MTFLPPHFNQVITQAWSLFVQDPKTVQAAVSAFAKAGLHPLVDILAQPLVEGGTGGDVLQPTAQQRKSAAASAKLAHMYILDDQDKVTNQRVIEEGSESKSSLLSVQEFRVRKGALPTLVSASPSTCTGSIGYKQHIFSISNKLNESSFFKPANALISAVTKYKRSQKRKSGGEDNIDEENEVEGGGGDDTEDNASPRGLGCWPSTATGLPVTPAVLDAMRDVQAHRTEAKQAKAAAAEQSATKKALKVAEDASAKAECIAAYQLNPTTWLERFTRVDPLRRMWKVLAAGTAVTEAESLEALKLSQADLKRRLSLLMARHYPPEA